VQESAAAAGCVLAADPAAADAAAGEAAAGDAAAGGAVAMNAAISAPAAPIAATARPRLAAGIFLSDVRICFHLRRSGLLAWHRRRAQAAAAGRHTFERVEPTAPRHRADVKK